MQDAVDRVLGLGVACQVIQDFRRGREQGGFVWHTLQRSTVPLAPAMPLFCPGASSAFGNYSLGRRIPYEESLFL
jgi:hypothetical protein